MPHSQETLRHLVSCAACSRQYDATGRSVGERFRCRCGKVLRVPPPRGHEAKVVRCSSCGGPRKAGERACGFCGADFTLHERDLQTVCPDCAARISDQASFCHHCGSPIVPEEDSREISDLACPGCGGEYLLSSRSLGKEKTSALECGRCAGLWLGNDVFALLERKAKTQAVLDLETAEANLPPSPPGGLAQQHGSLYRPCPSCGKLMNRRNYGRRSGVVIDVCKSHGIWFDDSELARILAWVREGGQERQREIEREEEREKTKREMQQRAKLKESALLGHRSLASPSRSTTMAGTELLVDLVDFLGGFRWR